MAEREQLDDRALVARILEGDRDRFTELVRRYEKRLVNYVYRITHRYEDAHDLAQEIFVKVYLALDRYDSKYQFSTWLFRIAQNASIDALRKKSIAEVPMARTGGSIRLVRTSIEVLVVVSGWLLGGTFGAGTILYALSIGPLVQLFLPRLVVRRAPAAYPDRVPVGRP